MAYKGIKGITIELGADTTGLDQALKKVNKTAESTATELKQVERMLKFDPSNTELLAQKQAILADQISNTSQKLEVLKTAQSQVQEKFDKGEIGAEQYRAFQRELINTESYLKSLQEKAESLDLEINPPEIELTPVEKAIDALKGLQDESKLLTVEQGKLNSEFKLQKSQLGENATELDKLELEHKQLNQQMELTGKVVSNLESQLDQAKTAFGANSKEVMALESKLNNAKTSLNETQNAIKKIEAQKITFQVDTDVETTPMEEASNLLKEMQSESKLLSAEQNKLTSEFKLQSAQLGENATEVDKLELAHKQLSQQLELSKRNVDSLEEQLKLAVTAFGENSSEVMEFESKLNKAKASLIDTENALKDVAQKKVDIQVEAEADTKEVSNLKDKIDELPSAAKTAGKAAAIGIAAVGAAAVGAVAGISSFVDGQKEMASDMARLSTNAEQAGLSVDKVNEAFTKVSAISGEADSAVETVSNLLATGMSENQLAEALDYVNGAAIKFSDTLKTEGIADGLQETFATGEAVGQFGELLERSGVNLDTFNDGLAQAQANGTGMDYVLQQMSQLGLAESYDAYLKNNEALAAYNQAQAESEQKMAQLSTALMPLATMLTELKNLFIDVALGNTSLSEALQQLFDKSAEIFPQILEKGRELFTGLITAMEEMIPNLLSFASDNLPQMIDSIKEFIPDFIDSGINIVSSIIEGIAEMIPDLLASAVELVAEFLSSIIDKLPDIIQTGVQILTSLIQGIIDNLPRIASTVLNLIGKFVQAIIDNLPTIFENGVQLLGALINGIISVVGNLATIITTEVLPAIWDTIKNTDWIQLGKDILNGIIKGVTNTVESVLTTIRGVADNIKNAFAKKLGIASPSKVFTEFGEWIGIGLADGIESTENINEKVTKKLADSILDIKEASKNELVELEKELVDDIAEVNEKAEEKILKIQQTATKKKRKLTTAEQKEIKKIRQNAANDIAKLEKKAVEERIKIFENESKEIESRYKEMLDDIKSFIDEKKSLNQMSLKDEVLLWKESVSLFEDSNEQKIAAQKAYRDALEKLNNEIVSVNESYSNQILAINENLIKEEEALTQAYEDVVNKRAATLSGFANIFDAYEVKVEKTGIDLINNLRSQVVALNQWRYQFEALSKREILSDALLDEISEMGVDALDELIELNKLTDEQLSEYSSLYEEKMRSAREQAEKEFEETKNGLAFAVAVMREKAEVEMSKLEDEWAEDIRALTEVTETELLTMEQIGKNAGQGLLNGLSSMESSLSSKAKQIADSISKTIKDALQVKSPSRVMIGIGENVGEGLIIGMDDMLSKVSESSSRLSNALISAQASMSSSSAKSQASQVTQQQIYHNQSIDMSGLIQAISALAQRPIQTTVAIDGQAVGHAVSDYQYNNANLNALLRGVTL